MSSTIYGFGRANGKTIDEIAVLEYGAGKGMIRGMRIYLPKDRDWGQLLEKLTRKCSSCQENVAK